MNNTILISGASSGLGKALALAFLEKGATVYGTSRSPEKYDLPFNLIKMDLESPETIQSAIATVIKEVGRIDVLLNNAGIGLAGPLEHQRVNSLEKLWRTNVTGALLLSKQVVPYMREQGTGKLINISSLGAALGLPYRSAYCASKAALDLLSDSWRMELKPFSIQSTSIWCGDMQTPIGEKRLQDIDPDDPVYAESYPRVYQAIDEDVYHSLPVKVAAQEIVRICGQKKLKRRYTVAKPLQKAAVWAKWLLPHSTFDTIINRFSKL